MNLQEMFEEAERLRYKNKVDARVAEIVRADMEYWARRNASQPHNPIEKIVEPDWRPPEGTGYSPPEPQVAYPSAPAVEPVVDVVLHPPHYTDGGIETIDFIYAKLTNEQFYGYCLAAAIKYLSRCGKKGDAVEDLRKAGVYIKWAINALRGEALEK